MTWYSYVAKQVPWYSVLYNLSKLNLQLFCPVKKRWSLTLINLYLQQPQSNNNNSSTTVTTTTVQQRQQQQQQHNSDNSNNSGNNSSTTAAATTTTTARTTTTATQQRQQQQQHTLNASPLWFISESVNLMDDCQPVLSKENFKIRLYYLTD